ncbi:MAG: hypothetical protein JWR16_1772 [Nevskia sp.]|nr:hypothetical protein [Nevskia sp.]
MNINRIALSQALLLSALILPSLPAAADEFMALPGLWKTTTQTSGSAAATPAQVQWHCVDEDADPWIDFAQLEDASGASCTRSSFERTATSLKWRLDCSAPWPIRSEGSIVFDAPAHYSGTVKRSGTLLNYPLDDVVHIDGQRYAACTSPKD